jgi:hypothetical protein
VLILVQFRESSRARGQGRSPRSRPAAVVIDADNGEHLIGRGGADQDVDAGDGRRGGRARRAIRRRSFILERTEEQEPRHRVAALMQFRAGGFGFVALRFSRPNFTGLLVGPVKPIPIRRTSSPSFARIIPLVADPTAPATPGVDGK